METKEINIKQLPEILNQMLNQIVDDNGYPIPTPEVLALRKANYMLTDVLAGMAGMTTGEGADMFLSDVKQVKATLEKLRGDVVDVLDILWNALPDSKHG